MSDVRIEKAWDGNVSEREGNGRVYVSNGRWQWLVIVSGEVESTYDRKRDAVARVERLHELAEAALEAAREHARLHPSTEAREALKAAWDAAVAVAPKQRVSNYACRAGKRQAREREALRTRRTR